MASIITHALAGLALGPALAPQEAPRRFWVLGALCAAGPDADSLGFQLGVPYDSVLGHRGLTHSLVFAAGLSGLVVMTTFRGERWREERVQLLLYFFLATASHGLLDAITTGGRGVAFFAPFDSTRYFLPFRPVLVSPLNVRSFFGERGLRILASEARWIWLPALLVAGLGALARRRRPQCPA